MAPGWFNARGADRTAAAGHGHLLREYGYRNSMLRRYRRWPAGDDG
ncbi:hypothetical protein [Sphingomonas hankookensis]